MRPFNPCTRSVNSTGLAQWWGQVDNNYTTFLIVKITAEIYEETFLIKLKRL